MNWLLPTIFEFLRVFKESFWQTAGTTGLPLHKPDTNLNWSSLAVLSFVSDQLAEAPLNQASANIKCRISGVQRSLGSGRFIEHQINYLAASGAFMTWRSFTTTYFHTVASAIILHFKWQNQTISKLVPKLIQQLCVLIVINMYCIKEALLSCSQSQKRERKNVLWYNASSEAMPR